MVISFWHSWVVLSCIVIPCMFAKPFNLNEAIAAEEKQKGLQTTTRPKFEPETSKRFSLNKVLRTDPVKSKNLKATDKSERFSLNKILKSDSLKSKKLKATGNIFARSKKISPLQYRKTFQIKSPLKPKKLRSIKTLRHRRKNSSIKREIDEDEKISKKYIPLLRSLSLLFDNILFSDDSFEVKTAKLRKYRHSKRNKTECTCTDKPDENITTTESTKETAISTTPVDQISTIQSTEYITTEAPTTTTNYATNSDFSDLGQNTDLPTILPRDTSSPRGDHNGISEGSGPTFHTSLERHIPGDHGNSERYTGSGKYKPHTENYEENPDSTSREHASSTDFRRGVRGDIPDTRRPVYRRGLDEIINSKERKDDDDLRKDRKDFYEFEGPNHSKRKDSFRHIGRDFNESSGENKHEVGGDETESSKSVQQFIRGDRRFLSEESDVDVVVDHAEHFQEKPKEGIVGITHITANDQRIPDGNGGATEENKEIGPTNAALISIKDLNNPIVMLQSSPKHKAPFVTIIDGYSVARDKNGANKLAEQSIRFYS